MLGEDFARARRKHGSSLGIEEGHLADALYPRAELGRVAECGGIEKVPQASGFAWGTSKARVEFESLFRQISQSRSEFILNERNNEDFIILTMIGDLLKFF